MLQGKNKLSKTKKEEGDHLFVELHHYCSPFFFLLWSCVALQLLSRKKKVEL